MTIVQSDGSSFKMLSGVRQVGRVLQLERDPTNHPLYLVSLQPARMVDLCSEAGIHSDVFA
eukprot:6196796-Pleurochrysis_carterae.AAC.3